MRLGLSPMEPTLPRRYDGKSAVKFDSKSRVRAQHPDYKSAYKLWRSFREPNDRSDSIKVPKQFLPALADAALKVRNRIGLVLGSSAKRLFNRLDSFDGAVGSDFDVLILNPHGPENPAPCELDVDWFVRPKDIGYFPTNGMVECVYDLQPAMGLVTRPATQKSKYALKRVASRSRQATLDYDEDRKMEPMIEQHGDVIMAEAGLYLPDPGTIEEIIEYCNTLAANASSEVHKPDYSHLRPTITDYDPAFPVMPQELLKLVRRVPVQ